MQKLAQTTVPIHPHLASRWSPVQFLTKPVEPAKLKTLLEAARWTMSSYNEQPWRYIISTSEIAADHKRMIDCLLPGNQTWAQHVPVLLIAVAKKTFSHNGSPNSVAVYDVGAASAMLTVQATDLGLHVHQMGGIDKAKIIQTYGVPEDFQPLTALAIGYAGPNPNLSPDVAQRDEAPRTRRELAELVFTGQWGHEAETIFGR